MFIQKPLLGPYQYCYVCGKRTVTAFQWCTGLGVCDSVNLVKNTSQEITYKNVRNLHKEISPEYEPILLMPKKVSQRDTKSNKQ